MIFSPGVTQKLMAAVILLQAVALYFCLLHKGATDFVQTTNHVAVSRPSPNRFEVTARGDENIHTLDIEQSLTMEARNERRVSQLRQYCSRYNETIISTFPPYKNVGAITSYVWMTSSHHQLFYCATPKCGSTTWKSYLLEDLKLDWTGKDTHVAATQLGVHALYEKSGQDIHSFVRSHRPNNRLIIVRNPWARLVSAYDDKILAKKRGLKKMCYGWKKYQSVKLATFEQFIDCILQKPENLYYEGHTHPLTSLCVVCLMDYTLVLKLEEMDEAEPFLKKALNFTVEPDYKPPRKMKNNAYRENYKNITKRADKTTPNCL